MQPPLALAPLIPACSPGSKQIGRRLGNRLSDFQANRARQRPYLPQPLSLRELSLAECENHLTATDTHGSGLMLIDDIRRAALARM